MTQFYDAVVIDLDGTLVDTLGDFVCVLNLCLREMSLPSLASDDVRLMVGKGSEHLIASALSKVVAGWPELNCPQHNELKSRARELYMRHYPQVNGLHSHVYPGVFEGLQTLREYSIPLACLTNKPLAFARALLEQKNLLPHFSHVFGGDSFAHKKPHPEPLLQTCIALGSTPSRTLMVGDSSNDAQAAHAAGCPVALVTYGYNHGQNIAQCGHNHLLSDLRDLCKIC
ncbi:MAG: hypothetical protein RLZZ271_29 [Pseudomonadota bacterium]|jgi:phosphoglycolate phosphatase